MMYKTVPHLFEEFARERTSTETKVVGTGLGMPIVKALVDLMGGTIRVESKEGCGTKTTVDLPLSIASEKQIEESRRRQRRDDVREVLADKKILLVEDNDLNAEIAMTANAFEEDRKCALEVGMDGYIAKPIHMESVVDALQEGLAGKH